MSLELERIIEGALLAAASLSISSRFFALPSLPLLALSFDWSLAVPYLVGALACTLRAVGDITTCQRIANPDWVRPDMGSIERGIRCYTSTTDPCTFVRKKEKAEFMKELLIKAIMIKPGVRKSM